MVVVVGGQRERGGSKKNMEERKENKLGHKWEKRGTDNRKKDGEG